MPNNNSHWQTYVVVVVALLIGVPVLFLALDLALALFKVLFIVLLILLIPGLIKIYMGKKKTNPPKKTSKVKVIKKKNPRTRWHF